MSTPRARWLANLAQHAALLAVMVLTTLVYAVAMLRLPASVFWSPDEGAKYLQMRSMEIDAKQEGRVAYGGYDLDRDYKFYPDYLIYPRPVKGGETSFNWPAVFPQLSRSPHRLLGPKGLYLVPLLAGLACALLTGVLMRRFEPRLAPWAALAIGVGSPVCFYSVLFWEHTLAVMFGLFAMWTATRWIEAEGRRWPWLVATTLALLCAVVTRLEMLLYAAAFIPSGLAAAYLCRTDRLSMGALISRFLPPVLLSVLGFVIVRQVLLLWADSDLLFPPYVLLVQRGWQRLRDPSCWRTLPLHTLHLLINNSAHHGPRLPLFLTLTGLLGLVTCLVAGALRPRVRRILFTAGVVSVTAVSTYGLLFPPFYRAIHSILLPMPCLILAAWLWPTLREKGPTALFLALSTTIYLLGYLLVSNLMQHWTSGPEWGARAVLMAYPLLAVLAGMGFADIYRQVGTKQGRGAVLLAAVFLVLTGSQYAVRGVSMLQTVKHELKTCEEEIVRQDLPVVTDLWWLPSALAVEFARRDMFVLNRREDLLLWLATAGRDVERFVFVSSCALGNRPTGSGPHGLFAESHTSINQLLFVTYRTQAGRP